MIVCADQVNTTTLMFRCSLKLIEKITSALLFVCLSCPILFAQTFEEGKEAYLAKDYAKAIEILLPLAENGNSQAQVTLGIMYDYGHGVETNTETAFKWYKMAAEQGIPIVQHDLGVKYFQGVGIEKDYLEAARWWEMSANAGLPDSQFNLGLMHYRGLGLPQDYAKAESLFTQAADQDHGHAQYSLAVMYAFGQGVSKDYEIALDWFRRSAALNVAQAQYNLGVFYENGYGVTSDIEQAKHWYQLAADQGLAEAADKLSNITDAEPLAKTFVAEEVEMDEAEATDAVEPDVIEPIQQLETAQLEDNFVPVTKSDTGQIRTEEWVLEQAQNAYTIQIGSGLNENDIIVFIKENQLQAEAAYIKVFVKGITRYSALYGTYNSFSAAEQAVLTLPEHIQKTKPWVRRFGVLQGMLNNNNG